MSSLGDYPDFSRVDTWTGVPFINEVVHAYAFPQILGPFYVAPWETVVLDYLISSAAVAHTLSVSFSDPAAPATAIGGRFYDVPGTVRVTDTIPIMGPTMQLAFNNGAGNPTGTLQVTPRRGDTHGAVGGDAAMLFQASGAGIGAGVTQSALLAKITPGPAVFTANMGGASWQAILTTETRLGVTTGILGIIGTGVSMGKGSQTVMLPASGVRISVTNFDAAVQAWSAGLLALTH